MGSGLAAQSLLTVGVLFTAGITSARASATSQLPLHFSGLLNDYTPAAPAIAGEPYEMYGNEASKGQASFCAEMTMETADFANTDPNHDPTELGAHTHHISISDGILHDDPTNPINWRVSCPKFEPPVANGFVVTGTAYVTGNGGTSPFGNPSPVTVCILGGIENPIGSGSRRS
jgi:hypothetical protein